MTKLNETQQHIVDFMSKGVQLTKNLWVLSGNDSAFKVSGYYLGTTQVPGTAVQGLVRRGILTELVGIFSTRYTLVKN